MLAQPRFSLLRFTRCLQSSLGRENIVLDTQQCKVGADQVHHPVDSESFEQIEPLGFRCTPVAITELSFCCFADRFQIIAGV